MTLLNIPQIVFCKNVVIWLLGIIVDGDEGSYLDNSIIPINPFLPITVTVESNWFGFETLPLSSSTLLITVPQSGDSTVNQTYSIDGQGVSPDKKTGLTPILL